MSTTCTMSSFYLFLSCSVTLALVVLITTSHPPLLNPLDDSSLQDLHINVMVAEAERVAKQDNLKQLNHQGNSEQAATIMPGIRVSFRKLANSLLVDAPQFRNNQYDVIEQLSTYMPVRRLLLHEEKISSTTVTISASDAAKHTSANVHDTHHAHDVNESTAFHADYSRPNTHPPKNN